jgi:hypothetical protein
VTRFLITNDPGTAAHSAKNALAAPGLPNQPENYWERNTMVSATRAVLSETARRFAHLVMRDQVVYAPEALNQLIDTTVRREVAGRLRERAAWHRTTVDELGLPTGTRRAWHLAEADALEKLAAYELELLARGEIR